MERVEREDEAAKGKERSKEEDFRREGRGSSAGTGDAAGSKGIAAEEKVRRDPCETPRPLREMDASARSADPSPTPSEPSSATSGGFVGFLPSLIGSVSFDPVVPRGSSRPNQDRDRIRDGSGSPSSPSGFDKLDT